MGQRVGKAICGGIGQLLIQGHGEDRLPLKKLLGPDGRLRRTAEAFHHRTGVDGQVDHKAALIAEDLVRAAPIQQRQGPDMLSSQRRLPSAVGRSSGASPGSPASKARMASWFIERRWAAATAFRRC